MDNKLLKELNILLEWNTDKTFGTVDYEVFATQVIELLEKYNKKANKNQKYE